MIKAQRHVGINTDSMEESVRFYNLLGFNKILYNVIDSSRYINELSNLQGESLHMIKLHSDIAKLTIELVKYKNSDSVDMPIRTTGVGHLALEVENAIQMWQTLLDNNFIPMTKPLLSSDGGAHVFFCYDPNGFRIEFVELVKK